MATMDDAEIDRLEDIRRYGRPDNRVYTENDYFRLPPNRFHLIRNWTEWRKKTNERLIVKIINRNGHGFESGRELTGSAEDKTPEFFKGHWSFDGRRVKDEYGGRAIMDYDNEETRFEKKLIDENFFIFGIPRVSLNRMQRGNADNPYNALRYNSGDFQRLRASSSNNMAAVSERTCNINTSDSFTTISPTNSGHAKTIYNARQKNKQREHKVSWKDPPYLFQSRMS